MSNGQVAQGRRDDRAAIARRIPTLVALVVMWIALWSDLSIANLLGGTAVALGVMLFADQIKPRPTHHFNLRPALLYLGTFAKQLLVANWEVVKAVVRPDMINPGIIAMPLYGASDAVVTLVANSITLTPGTLTLETERRGDVAILYVHALDLSDPDAVREDVSALEKLAVDAFAGPKAQAVQARSLADIEAGEHPADAQRPGAAGDETSATRDQVAPGSGEHAAPGGGQQTNPDAGDRRSEGSQ